MDTKEFATGYDPSQVEPRWYPRWVDEGLFRAQDESDAPSYCIVIPPPNVTGRLHIGHALTVTIQDALIRWKRMQGFNTLWLPGTDHAGIATQMVVERKLKADEGVSRHDLGREAFLERVWDWKDQHGSRITEQLKVLGTSLDWDRERFTLDPGLSAAVREVFVRLHEEGLIYRAERLINWCPRCATALSDLEVDHDEGFKGSLWDFAYPLQGGGEIVVSTTRPETMLGDTAVAVHPDDERYAHLIGQTIRHPFVSREIPIVADAELVDPEFGTGAVKVTPAHDFNDFETGLRHELQLISILDEAGHVLEGYGAFSGLERFEARDAVLAALEDAGLSRGQKEHVLSVGQCQRCATVVEPMLSKQWFVKTQVLAEPAIAAVREGRTTIRPKRYEKVYFHWLENIRDWCVSRQLWWGHRIPAWYCDDCEHITVTRQDPSSCESCQSKNLRQDEDVLDTWFSSGLWPFSTLGWPAETPALRSFYPTDVMETGYDILFFWVARMMMMGLHFMGEVPFKHVYLHGMVRDAQGQKMSKTRGNVIDPLEVTAEYGADALRFALAAHAGQGRDMKLSLDTVAGYRNFCNKAWNAVRFSLPHLEKGGHASPEALPLSVQDRWIRSRCQRTVEAVDKAMEGFRLDDAASAVYQFFWHELCDWYLEMIKPALYGEAGPAQDASRATLAEVLSVAIRLLHPFMPYLTEELWARLPGPEGEDKPRCIVAPWPSPQGSADDEAEAAVSLLSGLTSAVRNLRATTRVPAKAEPTVLLRASSEQAAIIEAHGHLVCNLARLGGLEPLDAAEPPAGCVRNVTESGIELFLPLKGLIDLEAEAARLNASIAKARKELQQVEGKLNNSRFVANAPAAIVDKERARQQEISDRLSKLEEGLDAIAKAAQ